LRTRLYEIFNVLTYDLTIHRCNVRGPRTRTSQGAILCCWTKTNYLFTYVRTANSAFDPSGVGKWVPASTGKAKAGMVHSISGWTRSVQVKLWNPLRTRAIP